MQTAFHILKNMQKIIPLLEKPGGGVVKTGNTAHNNPLSEASAEDAQEKV